MKKKSNIWIYLLTLMGIFIMFINSCKKDNNSANNSNNNHPNLKIGQNYEGGVIFYIDSTGEHGLICAPTNQSTGIQWYNGQYIYTNATGTSIGTGKTNTNTVIKIQGAGNYAANLCNTLTLNGYKDWFLPSKEELNLLFAQKEAGTVSGFTNNFFWSSSEEDNNFAYYQDFFLGTQTCGYKNAMAYVRAIRAF